MWRRNRNFRGATLQAWCKLSRFWAGDQRGLHCRFFGRHTIGKLNAGFLRDLRGCDFRVILFLFLPCCDDSMADAIQKSVDEVITLPRQLTLRGNRLPSRDSMSSITPTSAWTRSPTSWHSPAWRRSSASPGGTRSRPAFRRWITSSPAHSWNRPTRKSTTANNLCNSPTSIVVTKSRLCPRPPKADRILACPIRLTLYVCTQSLYKLHPGFDSILLGILHTDPLALIVLLAGPQPHWKELLTTRFGRTIPAEHRRIHFLPQQTQSNFLHLQALADVLLDTFPFGGGNTSLEAFAFGTPIVTLAGSLMRGRITYACYQQMGLTECIASTPDEYVQMALRSGCDPEWYADKLVRKDSRR